MKVCNALCRDDTVHGTYYYLASEADGLIDRLTAERDEDAERRALLFKQNVVLTAERDAALAASRHETDLCQQALDDMELWRKNFIEMQAERDAYQRAADKMAMEHKIERDGLGVQIDALAKYQLSDSLYPGSKDWLAGDYAARVEWLHTGYEAKKAEIESLLQQVAIAHGEMKPNAIVSGLPPTKG